MKASKGKKILIYYEQYGYGGVDTHLSELINNWPSKKDYFVILTNPNNEGFKFLKKKINFKNCKFIILNNVFGKLNFINYNLALLRF